MGLFDKVKDKLKGKNWLEGYSCPMCGSRVYKTGCEEYSCECCGNLTGDAYYGALRCDWEQQGLDDYRINALIEMYKRDKEQKIQAENNRIAREKEAKAKGDTRTVSKYDWLDYTENIIIGLYSTKATRTNKDSKGYALLRIYSKETDPQDNFRFYVRNVDGDDIGECWVYLTIYIEAKNFFVDKEKTTKDALYIIINDIHAKVNYTGLHYLVQDNPHLFDTEYGSISETFKYFSDWALKKFRQEVIDEVYKQLRSAKRNCYGFDDITYSNIYFEQYN